jgi:hypothetical protein
MAQSDPVPETCGTTDYLAMDKNPTTMEFRHSKVYLTDNVAVA